MQLYLFFPLPCNWLWIYGNNNRSMQPFENLKRLEKMWKRLKNAKWEITLIDNSTTQMQPPLTFHLFSSSKECLQYVIYSLVVGMQKWLIQSILKTGVEKSNFASLVPLMCNVQIQNLFSILCCFKSFYKAGLTQSLPVGLLLLVLLE